MRSVRENIIKFTVDLLHASLNVLGFMKGRTQKQHGQPRSVASSSASPKLGQTQAQGVVADPHQNPYDAYNETRWSAYTKQVGPVDEDLLRF
jgi:hypothetical protein